MINTEKSKRLDGQLYYNQDPLLLEEHLNVQMLLHQYNHLPPNKRKKRRKLLKQILNHPPRMPVLNSRFIVTLATTSILAAIFILIII